MAGNADRSVRHAKLKGEPFLELQELFNRSRRRHRIYRHALVTGADSPNPADSLIESCGIPRIVEVNDDRRFLEIQPFTEQICREQQLDSLGYRNYCARRARRELSQHGIACQRTACHASSLCRQCCYTRSSREPDPQSVDGLLVMTKRDDAFARVRVA